MSRRCDVMAKPLAVVNVLAWGQFRSGREVEMRAIARAGARLRFSSTTIALAICALDFGATLSGPAQSQAYPDKPIKIIVPAAPGGPTDVPARIASQILPPRLGQPVVVENRPGAGGAIGARAVAASAP